MPFVKVEEVIQKVYNYVVVGGGTAGLVVATRLSEDPSVTVLVLEAGQENLGDSKIDMLAQIGHTFGNPQYDWDFPIVPQKGRKTPGLPWQRGKGLGGSSAMNFYCWIKPPAQDIDAIEALGNEGWNWTDYQKYSKKSENFHPPGKEQTDLYPHTYNPAFRGDSGPIHLTNGPHFHTIDTLVQKSLVNRGLKYIDDPYGGNITGTWICSSNVDPAGWRRSYSATAYLLPNIGRENLHVVTNALVSRVLFDTAKTDEDVTATGVEFIYGDKIYVAKANKEVILSAGAIKSPHILEFSGVGKSDILESIGIDVVVHLPGVGENVQEHVGFGISFELDRNHDSLDTLRDLAVATTHRNLYLQGKGLHRNGINSFAYFPLSLISPSDSAAAISTLENEIKFLEDEGKLTPGLKAQLDLQLKAYKDDKIPDCEIVGYPGMFSPFGKSYMSLLPILNHPVSRGTIHAKSKNSAEYPEIDPHYLESQVDLDVLVHHVKFARDLRNYEPFKSAIVKEVGSSAEAVTDEQVREWVKENSGTLWHTVGSCSMLPRDKNGVVDSKLKVYSTKNLRVADLSIIPLHIAAHTQATAYFVGEKAADIIKRDNMN